MVRTDKKSGYCCGTQYDLKSLSRADGDNADGIDTSRDRIMAIIDNEVSCRRLHTVLKWGQWNNTLLILFAAAVVGFRLT